LDSFWRYCNHVLAGVEHGPLCLTDGRAHNTLLLTLPYVYECLGCKPLLDTFEGFIGISEKLYVVN